MTVVQESQGLLRRVVEGIGGFVAGLPERVAPALIQDIRVLVQENSDDSQGGGWKPDRAANINKQSGSSH